jgi:Immunity protein 50
MAAPDHRKETDESAVTNAWLIRRIFGYWPVFHDAELLSVTLRRRTSGGKWQTDIELTLHHWGQDNPTWHGKDVHCKLTFLLEDVDGTEFTTENVSHPSWVNDLRFSRRDDGRIQVDLEPSTGFSLLLNCAVARVTRVEPYSP